MVLMVIYDLYPFDAAVRPNETDAVFVIDANGMLAFAVAFERFQPVARRDPEIVEFLCNVDLLEFAERYPLDVRRQVRRPVALVDFLGGLAAEGKDHLSGYLRIAIVTSSVIRPIAAFFQVFEERRDRQGCALVAVHIHKIAVGHKARPTVWTRPTDPLQNTKYHASGRLFVVPTGCQYIIEA
jgi:hypothetical protein